jgi:hypothetical protein
MLPPPLHQHMSGSGTQLKPEPQSDAWVQGKRYRNTHTFSVTVVQVPMSGGGGSHLMSGGHAGEVLDEHTVFSDAKQTMPSPQSASTLQFPGTHSRISDTSHGGGGGHGSWMHA